MLSFLLFAGFAVAGVVVDYVVEFGEGRGELGDEVEGVGEVRRVAVGVDEGAAIVGPVFEVQAHCIDRVGLIFN